ncbi:hypothetical protein [Candidatus Marimicrobium litorale]|uniref:Uncharacterized protein n=1 Tax=Candidatus Marimicrobium litorale TaxID=2518991 RepID=A0ABT3T3N9_9GAMM|nr:hypothetical protein [Candidatus Marimicrobium litorale]MCX2976888.1 hypothetical protein [Candidatus Marimicrobium litorale]
MSRFNLTFSGEILTGANPSAVRQRFGELFDIEDADRIERFFSGQTITLRRNLNRKEAAHYYHQLHLLGAVAALVKTTAEESADPSPTIPRPPAGKDPSSAKTKTNQPAETAATDALGQVWAVGSKGATSLTRKEVSGAPARTTKNPINLSARIKASKEAARNQAEEQREKESARLSAREVMREAEESQLGRAETKNTRLDQEKALQKEQERPATQEKTERTAEAARIKAEAEEQQHREEAARKKAEAEEQQRREDTACKKAEAEEQQRREEAARKKAEAEEQQRREGTARKKAEAEEQQRREEAARKKAEAEEQQRREEAARKKAEAEEQQRREETARKKAEAEERQRLASELTDIDQQTQEKIRLIQSDALQKRSTAKQLSDKRLLAIDHGTHSSAAQRTGFLVLSEAIGAVRAENGNANGATPPVRTHQAGEPNFYSLRPFRNTEKVKNRASSATTMKKRSLQLGAAAALLFLVSAAQLFTLQDKGQLNGPRAVAIDSNSGVVLLAEDTLLMHDRAGVFQSSITATDLGLHSLRSPLAFDAAGTMIIAGSILTDSGETSPLFLARCNMQKKSCAPLLQSNLGLRQFIVNPMDNSILLAGAGQLIKIDPQGKISAEAKLALAESAVMRLHAGLLFISSVEGPAISVYRYEDSAFAKQLDEILLIPPLALESGRSKVANFAWSANAWWVVLRNPDSGDQGVYRFDENWGFLNEIKPVTSDVALKLVSWGEKTLIHNFRDTDIARFNAAGKPEIPFTSSRLAEIFSTREEHSTLARWLWQGGVIFASLLLFVCAGAVVLSGLRQQVYKSHRASGAEPVDEYAPKLRWIDPAVDRAKILRQRAISYYLIALAIVIIAAAQSVDTWHMCALLLFLSGPGIALSILRRSSAGHIGILFDRLLLVNTAGMYHIAGGSNIQFRGAFLVIDDVIVFTGSRLLPAFNKNQVTEWASPLVTAGIKVDSKTIVVKLLEARHPVALAICSLMGGSLSALLALGLRTIFQP